MSELAAGFVTALRLVLGLNAELLEIMVLSLRVSSPRNSSPRWSACPWVR